jgi:RimJ/RimL family protein N-acetyltransferase
MENFSKYGVKMRFVEPTDALFIIDIRTDEKKKKYISATDISVEKQIQWINGYKLREQDRKEYYFIAVDEEGENFATYRVYNIENNTAEIGSWVTKPGYKKTENSIKVDIIMKEFVFEELGFDILNFEVRKENKSVLRYHKMFGPEVVKETEQDIFFVLNREEFFKNRNRLFKNIK